MFLMDVNVLVYAHRVAMHPRIFEAPSAVSSAVRFAN